LHIEKTVNRKVCKMKRKVLINLQIEIIV